MFQGGGTLGGQPLAVLGSTLFLDSKPIVPDLVTGVPYDANYSTGQIKGAGSVTFAASVGVMTAIKAAGLIATTRSTIDCTVSNGQVSHTLTSPYINSFTLSCNAQNNAIVAPSVDFIALNDVIGSNSTGTPPSQNSFIPQFLTTFTGSIVNGQAVSFEITVTNNLFVLYTLDGTNTGYPSSIQYGLLKVNGNVMMYGGTPPVAQGVYTGTITGIGTTLAMNNLVNFDVHGDVTGPNNKPFQMVTFEAIGNGESAPIS